jgi:hypothetical protein
MTRAGSLASQLTARYFAETSTVAWMHEHTYLIQTQGSAPLILKPSTGSDPEPAPFHPQYTLA